jgi:hypothetical protein
MSSKWGSAISLIDDDSDDSGKSDSPLQRRTGAHVDPHLKLARPERSRSPHYTVSDPKASERRNHHLVSHLASQARVKQEPSESPPRTLAIEDKLVPHVSSVPNARKQTLVQAPALRPATKSQPMSDRTKQQRRSASAQPTDDRGKPTAQQQRSSSVGPSFCTLTCYWCESVYCEGMAWGEYKRNLTTGAITPCNDSCGGCKEGVKAAYPLHQYHEIYQKASANTESKSDVDLCLTRWRGRLARGEVCARE